MHRQVGQNQYWPGGLGLMNVSIPYSRFATTGLHSAQLRGHCPILIARFTDHSWDMDKLTISGLRPRVLLLVALAVAPWLLTTLYHAVEERESVISKEQEHALRLARIFAYSEKGVITRTRALLESLSSIRVIHEGGRGDCQMLLASFRQASQYYANLGVTDADGTLLCDARATQKSISFADRAWLQQAVKTRRFATSNLLTSRITGKLVVVLANPLLNAQGAVERVIYASVDFNQLKRLLEQVEIPRGATVSLMDAQGIIAAQYPDMGKQRGKPHPLAPLLKAIQAKKADGVDTAADLDGLSQLYAYHRVFGPSTPDSIYISVTMPTSSLLAERDRLFAREMGILGLTSVLIFALIWWGTDILVLRKMKALLQSARKIAQGNFAVRTQAGAGGGELGQLARVFDDMAESLELLFQQSQHIMEVTPEAIIVSDSSGKIVMVNAQAEELFGYSRAEMVGASIETLVPDRFRAIHTTHRKGYIALDAPPLREMGKGRELFARKKDGSEFSTEISLGPLKTKAGNFVISAVRDVTERKQFEARIRHQATHDALTGLPNRLLFHDILVHAAAHAQRTEKLLAVMFLDLDGFKYVNDTLGHEYGDRLLKEIAQRLTITLRGNDLVARSDDIIARQGGDEFTILLQGIAIVENIIQIAERILAAVAEPFMADDHEIHITASLGITVFPFDDTNIESLLQNADTAMYRAKENGKNNFQFYTAEMNALIRERMAIENGLRQALARNEFVLHYQPQMDIKTGKMVGVEALVRWAHPEKGLISPAIFIPVAEESGLIVPLGEWVLRTACQQRKHWQDAGLPHVRMAVNLSARQFRDAHLVMMVAKAWLTRNWNPIVIIWNWN